MFSKSNRFRYHLSTFETLLILNITALFYLAFTYIPRLERDVEESYKRIVYLNKIKNKIKTEQIKQIKSIKMGEIDEAINANKELIEAFTTRRFGKVYVPLFLLAFPVLLIPLIISPIVSSITVYAPMYTQWGLTLWSLMLFLGMVIPFITTVGAMIHNRPYSKFEKIHRNILSQNDYENLLLE